MIQTYGWTDQNGQLYTQTLRYAQKQSLTWINDKVPTDSIEYDSMSFP